MLRISVRKLKSSPLGSTFNKGKGMKHQTGTTFTTTETDNYVHIGHIFQRQKFSVPLVTSKLSVPSETVKTPCMCQFL